MSMTGSQAYALSKKYTNDMIEGAGALKGKSAYEIAVDHGFVGSEAEWLRSLKGQGAGFDFEQPTKSSVWTITHSLNNRYPNIVCVDENGDQIFGDVNYYSDNVTIITFCTPVMGAAHLTQSGGAGAGGEGMSHVVLDRAIYEQLTVTDPDTVYLIKG